MATVEEDLKGLGDRELAERLGARQKTIKQIEKTTPATPAGKVQQLEALKELVDDVVATKGELQAREDRKRESERRSWRDALPGQPNAKERKDAELAAEHRERLESACGRVGERIGVVLVSDRLDHGQGAELIALVNQLTSTRGAAPEVSEQWMPPELVLDDTELQRYRELVSIAAGEEDVFARLERERETGEKLAEAREAASLQLMPRPKPGGVALPSYVFKWLEGAKGRWEVADIGVLAAILSSFNTERPVFRQSGFEGEGEDRVLFVKSTPQLISNSEIDVRDSLERLQANKFVTVTRYRGGYRIALGERGRNVQEAARAN